MEILEQRKAYIKQAVMLARDSYAVGAAFSVGEDALDPNDIRILCIPKDNGDPVAVYKKLNYLMSNDDELHAGKGEILSRDPECIKKKYELEGGFTLTVYIAGTDIVNSMKWWRPLFDGMKIVDSLDTVGRVSEDMLKDGEDDSQSAAAPAEDTAGRFKRRERAEPEAAVVAAAVIPEEEPPVQVQEEIVAETPTPDVAAEETDENDEYWDFVSAQIRNARHAINAESYIRANEILNVLRKMLIELICVRNGVESEFETAIDYIECEEKDMLIKTYPMQMSKGSFITALSTMTTLFDRLG